ncbi:MAG: FAD-dependent oxidoreductase [Planctomycetales bacterium]|nr:FAD-dependent oxidoreductase [Planctomycetales bacterium]
MSYAQHNRRDFTKRLATGTAALITGAGGAANAQEAADRSDAVSEPTRLLPGADTPRLDSYARHVRTAGKLTLDQFRFQEAARDIPVAGRCDVLVCGGGPAGYAAALAAARSGARTGLIEVNGCVGGVWTAGALSLIIDSKNKPGIMLELRRELDRLAAGHWVGSSIAYDPETMKRLLEEKLIEAGVEIRLHTRIVGAVADERGKLSVVLTESKSGREVWLAKAFVDCTGDGDLAAQAGCEFDLGDEAEKATQPMSLMALFTGVETDGIAQFIRGEAEPRGLGNPKANLLEEFRSAGVDPSYAGPTIFRIRHGFYAMMANHQYAALAIDADHVTKATLEARQEIHRLIGALRRRGGPWAGIQLAATGEQIGTREGRRIRGLYRVSSDDLRLGSRFDDAICHVTFGIDVHSTNPDKTKGIAAHPFRSKSYDIPLRALIARDVDGLMMAGRCISGDFIAHSSYRVTGDAVTMGEAAGATSALAAISDASPRNVPFSDVSRQLASVRAESETRAAAS